MTLEQEIKQFAEHRNLEVGITTTEPFLELQQILIENNSDLQGFVEQDITKRIYPCKTMPEAKSIIVFAMGYGVRKKLQQCDTTLMGEFSIAAVATDYHIALKEHFKALEQFLKQKIEGFECKYFVDTGPLVDRAVAVRAGLGWIGKNNCVHTAKFGSLAFFGYMMTNLSLKQNKQIIGDCGSCKRCITFCPTGALSEKRFDMKKCISYLTQTKTVLSVDVMKTMSKQLYGCDVCQIVCPKNQKALQCFEQKQTSFSLEEMLHCSNKTFSQNISKTAAGWRGKKILQRNAVIALGNSGTIKALPLLEQALKDERELIRHTAIRAVYNLNIPEGFLMLKQIEKIEKSEEIKQELQIINKML
ncbi:tRNA epoxyqueuosine(34) reductase QueG [Clostridium sp. MD294]|uniref:tRNA epoxyqueuosine(34) reductase QueG n=1 Tax=Clostridium sp. MD294 TaxID=97138 RepID=UPI0002CB4CF2|nr:tRNA epoxyqueuosine(34) reductase QueG [Clostridium sp. MD294]NDO46440.1 tRNA epoxyqueuosine(34) reductase QueG [Clostridium sp. MD294]USF29130.1 Epoxyqueuosine reductase [Clostridium sp. MD294]